MFGTSPYDVGIVAKRTAGGNQHGLDLFTGNVSRVSITSAGNVGLGLSNPGVGLELADGKDIAIGNTRAYMVRDNTGVRRRWAYLSAFNVMQIGTLDALPTNGNVRIVVNGTEMLAFYENGSIVPVGPTLPTTATDGFLYLSAMSGPPTGSPTAHPARVPITVDQSNNTLYFHSGGSWRSASGGGGGSDPTKLPLAGGTLTGTVERSTPSVGNVDGSFLKFPLWTASQPSGQRHAVIDLRVRNTGTGSINLIRLDDEADTVDTSATIAMGNLGNSDSLYMNVAGKASGTTTPTGIGIDLNRNGAVQNNATAYGGFGIQIYDWSSTNFGLDAAKFIYLLKTNNPDSGPSDD